MSGQEKERIAILVTGMHRSGTSALTRVLNIVGCDLPTTLMRANPTNEAGHWEPLKVALLNDEILASAGSSWRDWRSFNQQWYASPVADMFRRRAQETLDSEYGDSPLFVLKDPRICRLLPFWIEVVRAHGAEPLVVSPIRNPLDVAASLEVRDGIDPSIGHLLWLRNVLDAEKDTRGMKRVWLRYDALLSETSTMVDVIGETLGVSWPKSTSASAQIEIDEFISSDLRHHQNSDGKLLRNPILSHWIKSSFEIFNRWACGDAHDKDIEELDRIKSAFDAALPAFSRAFASRETAVAERDGQIEGLNRAVAERDGQIEGLNRAVAERDGQIEGLNRAVAERDGQIEGLNRAVAERDGQIEGLNRAVAERDGQIEGLNRTVAERDGQIEELNRAVAERDERIDSLYNSKSWRITAPLRLPRRLWQICRSSPHANGAFHNHRLMNVAYRSRLLRKMVDLSLSILHRYPLLIPVARRMLRLLPLWMSAVLRRYHYKWKMTSSPFPNFPKKREVDDIVMGKLDRELFEQHAKRGGLTKGWYGGRELRPEETCLAKTPPSRAIVELEELEYQSGSNRIRDRYLSEQEQDDGVPPYLRYAPLDEYRDFLAERCPPDSAAEMFDCGGFTVITPFHRHLNFFAKAAASVDRLFFGDEKRVEIAFEWVVVNDDPAISDDELSERIPKRLLPAVRQIRPDAEGGIVDALNSGIRHGQYRWLLFLDCDDEIESNTFTVLDHYRKLFPRCRYISSSMIDIDEQSSVLRFRGNEYPIDRLFDVGMLASHLKAIRRDLFDDIGLLDPRFDFCQDYEFALRASAQEPILKIPEPLYRYRWHEKTQSVSRADRQRNVHQRIQREYLRKFLSIREKMKSNCEITELETVIHSVPHSCAPLRGAVIIRTQGTRLKMLFEAVESVIAQIPPLTPIVVVHGNDDDLWKVKNQLCGKMDVVFLHASKPNRHRGYPANIALNYIEDQADQFDFVSFLDDDDILYPCFSSVIGEALMWSGVDFVYAMSNKSSPGRSVESGPTPHPASCQISDNYITINSFGLTTEFLCRSGIRFDEDMHYLEDWDFILSLWNAGARFRFFPETVSEFRITSDGNTIWKRYPELYAAATVRMQEKAWNIAIAQEAGLVHFQREMVDFEWPETRAFDGSSTDLAYGVWMKAEQHRSACDGKGGE